MCNYAQLLWLPNAGVWTIVGGCGKPVWSNGLMERVLDSSPFSSSSRVLTLFFSSSPTSSSLPPPPSLFSLPLSLNWLLTIARFFTYVMLYISSKQLCVILIIIPILLTRGLDPRGFKKFSGPRKLVSCRTKISIQMSSDPRLLTTIFCCLLRWGALGSSLASVAAWLGNREQAIDPLRASGSPMPPPPGGDVCAMDLRGCTTWQCVYKEHCWPLSPFFYLPHFPLKLKRQNEWLQEASMESIRSQRGLGSPANSYCLATTPVSHLRS